MKNQILKKIMGMTMAAVFSLSALAGCGQKDTADQESAAAQTESSQSADTGTSQNSDEESQAIRNGAEVTELEVRFGNEGEPFMMQLEDNDTAKVIAGYVGTTDWRLPIYERDDGADYSVLQYYDIPSRYEIPSDPQTVTHAKAGEVYYSDPNRIVLYYHDADIDEQYTKVGTFDATEEFVEAVANNPVLEGWGNKIVQIGEP